MQVKRKLRLISAEFGLVPQNHNLLIIINLFVTFKKSTTRLFR